VESALAESSSNPLVLWEKMIGEMEKEFGAFAHQAMASSQSAKATNPDAPKPVGDLMESYFLAMNLPSRTQIVDMADQLQSIGAQLNDIKTLLLQMNAISDITQDGVAKATKTPRTKRSGPSSPGV
jgi:hypothetical protein